MAILGERLRPKSSARAELLTHDTTRYATLLVEPGSRSPESLHGIPLRQGGITLEDIARLAERNVYAIQTFWQTKGFMKNSRGSVRYETEQIKEQGTAYIDGKLISVEQAVERAGKYGEDVRTKLEDANAIQVVQTRSRGSWKVMWLPYNDEVDQIVKSQPVVETA